MAKEKREKLNEIFECRRREDMELLLQLTLPEKRDLARDPNAYFAPGQNGYPGKGRLET